MFIIYALILGIAAGYLGGGKLSGLSSRVLYWKAAAIAAFAAQLAIFTHNPLSDTLPHSAIVAIHLFSYAALFIFIFRNIRVSGIAVIGSGIFANALVIFINGGYMPTPERNFNEAGIEAAVGSVNNNTMLAGEKTLLPWLGDIFHLPEGLPLSNAFSIGDILIAAGIFVYLFMNMRSRKQS